MFPLSLADLASICGGMLKGDGTALAQRVVIDSRQVQKGDLFVALRGARSDGHTHLHEVFARGAAGAIVEADGPPRPEGLPVVVVPQSLGALADMARAARARLQAQVIGITGSVGKTTAKDFLAFLLGGPQARVFAAPASYNSEIGLPLAVLAAPSDSRILVLEYGINAPGEMAELIGIVRPDHAWLTAIAEAHLAGLKDLATVAHEKCLLTAAVQEGKSIWIDSETREAAGEECHSWSGLCQQLDPLQLEGGLLRGAPGHWRLEHPRFGSLQMQLGAKHQVATALTAAHIAASFGVSDEDIAQRLPLLQPPAGRMSLHRFGTSLLIEDSYNANPASMRAALEALAQWPSQAPKWAVLGTMGELGPGAKEAHVALGQEALAAGVQAVVTVGKGGAWIAEGIAQAGPSIPVSACDTAEDAAQLLEQELPDEVVLLLKASRQAGLEIIRQRLLSARPRALNVVEESA